MKVMIIGSGGREHAMAWKVAQSSQVKQVYVVPGNAGTHREPNVQNVDLNPLDFDELILFVKKNHIDLTLVGPEVPLAQGIRDAFDEHQLACFGPNKKAAQLEGSKSFAKDFLSRHNIPTARAATFTDAQQAIRYLEHHSLPVVIKADGLCAGKGVVIAQTLEHAHATVDDMLNHGQFSDAGRQIVIEEFLKGEEASFIVITDGNTCFPFATSQDHKARDNGDQGPNTGGMGAYSPAPIIDPSMHDTVMKTIIDPTLKGLKEDGIDYQGFLYAGLMITESGPKVLEFNCRLGDPEAQPLMMRLNQDLVTLCQASLEGTLSEHSPQWATQSALGVVMAAQGYPQKVHTGDEIQGLNDLPSSSWVKVFHGATQMDNTHIKTSGGRVLCVCALGDTLQQAKERAYQCAQKIHWRGAFYRDDIGDKALNYEIQNA